MIRSEVSKLMMISNGIPPQQFTLSKLSQEINRENARCRTIVIRGTVSSENDIALVIEVLRDVGISISEGNVRKVERFGAYFPLTCSASDIIDKLSEILSNINVQQCIYILGDLNASIRVTQTNKLNMILSFLAQYNISLCHNDQVTYICFMGSSCIDLAFSNVNNITLNVDHSSEYSILRKHKPVSVVAKLETIINDDWKEPVKYSRYIDSHKLSSSLLHDIMYLLSNEGIHASYSFLCNSLIKACGMLPKERVHNKFPQHADLKILETRLLKLYKTIHTDLCYRQEYFTLKNNIQILYVSFKNNEILRKNNVSN
ncbi:hypothetical protein GJ496_009595 [Pomphorhynchus laevis]|nr:hypothetical protein GJ496_009595 [Pomphorhynchus laevis]